MSWLSEMAEHPAFISLRPSFCASRKIDLKHNYGGVNTMIVASSIVIILTESKLKELKCKVNCVNL